MGHNFKRLRGQRMQFHKKFTEYKPEAKTFGETAVYLEDENGLDWYESQAKFSANTLKVMFDDNGLIVSSSRDVSSLFPLNCGVLEIDTKEDGLNGSYVINGKLVKTPKPSKFHEWNGTEWIIPKEKQDALFAKDKESLLDRLANKADEIKTNLLVGYPQTEIESFYRQEKEALAWQTDNKVETPMLKQIARVRGVPFEVLVEKVIEKASQFAVAIGVIIGQRQAFEDRLLVLSSQKELDALKKEIEEWTFSAN